MKKKISVIYILIAVSLLLNLVSCSNIVGNSSDSENSVTDNGSISGTVIYSNQNESSNYGIIVNLEKTDGLQVISANKSISGRSMVTSARTVVSSCVTQKDGSYAFNNLEPGTYTVYATSSYSKEKSVYTNAVVRSAETTVVESLKLTATGSISGTVMIDTNTSGNAGFLVFVAGTSFMAMTDDAGNYTISDVPAGSGYQVVATKNGVIHNLSSNVTVIANDSVSMSDNSFTAEELEVGLKGDKGNQGNQGEKGELGIQGLKGLQGDRGEQGLQGLKGEQGIQGEQGLPGIKGEQGDQGEQGLQGEKGEQGNQGEQGLSGEKGETGDRGMDGISIVWLGAFDSASEINNPKYLNAYFNKTDGCSYIYNGTEWKLLAKSGLNGTDVYSALEVETKYNTEDATNQSVVITISPSKKSLKKIGYIYSTAKLSFTLAADVFKNKDFINLTKDSNGKYKIEAVENGYYTIAAIDNDGFVSYVQKQVLNIDKVAPGAVSSLKARYNRELKQLTVTWSNPADSDFDHADLSYTKGGTTQVTHQKITESTYSISNVDVDGKEYVFNIFAIDKAGNSSSTKTVSIIPKAYSIGDVYLNDGTIVPYDEYDLTFTSDQKKKAVGVLCDINADGTPKSLLGIYNSANGKNKGSYSWASKESLGYNSSLTDIQGSISSGDFDGCDNWYSIVQIDQGGANNAMLYYPAFNYSNNYASTFGITGEYAKGWYMPSVAELYKIYVNREVLFSVISALGGTSLTGKYWSSSQYGNKTQAWKFDFSSGQDSYSEKDSVFNVCCVRSVTPLSFVYAVSTKYNRSTKELSVTWKTPVGSDFSYVNLSYSKGSKVQLENAQITEEKFSISNVKCEDWTYTFTVFPVDKNGNKGKVSKVSIIPKNNAIGDVLLNDGTVVPYDKDRSFTTEQKQKAVGVLYAIESDTPKGWLGINNSSGGKNCGAYAWAATETTGYNTYFADINCDGSSDYYYGDRDGEDNWDYICSVDLTGAAEAANNYPAFNYANNYAVTFGLEGDYATGWYIPSIYELKCIYEYNDILSSVIKALGGISLDGKSFWSSSQYRDAYNAVDDYATIRAWYSDFNSSYAGSSIKKDKDDIYVLCVRKN